MKIIVNLFALVIAMGIVTLIVAVGYYGAVNIWGFYMELEYTTRIVLLSGVIAVIFAAFIVVMGLRASGRINARGQLADKRHELYAHILMIYRTLLDRNTDSVSRDELIEELGQTYADLLILSSGAAIKAHIKMLAAVRDNSNYPEETEKCFQNLLKSFRRDIGHVDGYEFNNLKEIFKLLPSVCSPAERPQLVN